MPDDRAPGERLERRRVIVRGAVQGVGFRPFVWREATRAGLSGWVRNSAQGVTLEVEGRSGAVRALLEALRRMPPPTARVRKIEEGAASLQGGAGFSILPGDEEGGAEAEVTPDLATCDACLAEMRDPSDRRFRYPFINCTECGPRYSLIEALPYERSRTSMRRFAMCADCRAEYEDPRSRRFHAEPIACPACGPRLSLLSRDGSTLGADVEALQTAAAAIRAGRIVAVKGIGGYHLMADARDEEAIRRLRARKRREAKPFAVMFPDLSAVRAACRPDVAAEALLSGRERPIVLLPWDGGGVCRAIAPGLRRLGAMLPYAPLHHLLMSELGFPVAATSGNLSGDPLVIDEETVLRRLAGVADLFLVHDRPILRPVDDSVAQIVDGRLQLLRRARGYAPAPVGPPGLAEGVLAFGGHLKAAVAAGGGCGLVTSQHLGDLDGAPARDAYAAAATDLPRLHRAVPRLAVRDLHPDYASSHAAEASGLPVVAVQHHVAHAAGCLAEHGLAPPALGVCWDGSGYGADGTVWGGEFLHLTRSGWRRVARLRPFPLPGGDAAVREPRRAAIGLLHEAFGEAWTERTDLAPLSDFGPEELAVLQRMLSRGLNTPRASSAGRLFDAVAALCGLRQRSGYEGQAAAELEAAAADAPAGAPYPLPLRPSDEAEGPLNLDWQPALTAILADLSTGAGAATVSRRFHDVLAEAIVAVARWVGEPRVVLTGGCFQNVRLAETTAARLRAAGFEPLQHRLIPPNDGGLAFGQAVWASWTHAKGEGSCASPSPAAS